MKRTIASALCLILVSVVFLAAQYPVPGPIVGGGSSSSGGGWTDDGSTISAAASRKVEVESTCPVGSPAGSICIGGRVYVDSGGTPGFDSIDGTRVFNAPATPATGTVTLAGMESDNTWTGSNDFAGATFTRPFKTGLYASRPGSCSDGYFYYATDHTPNLLTCSGGVYVDTSSGSSATVQFSASAFSPADADTLWFGGTVNASASGRGWGAPKTGTITAATVRFFNGGANGTTEASTISVAVNGAVQATLSDSVNNSSTSTYTNTGLSIAVTVGDLVEFRWVTPTWATNPTNVQLFGNVLIQ